MKRASSCPKRCGRLTEAPRGDGVVVDRCRVCAGIWLDRGELESLVGRRQPEYRDELAVLAHEMALAFARGRDEKAPARYCPRCHEALERGEHPRCPKILVDACPDCHGLWLDAGELEALEVAFAGAKPPTEGLFFSFWRGLGSLIGL